MTITELRQELERLEAAGKGGDYIGLQNYEGNWHFPKPLEVVTEPRWVEKYNTNTSWLELTDEHWIKLED